MMDEDVCCPCTKTYSSNEQVMICGPPYRKTVTSGKHVGWKFKCPLDKMVNEPSWFAEGTKLLNNGINWLKFRTILIGISLYQII
jgi:hypothetical protein